MGLLCHAHWVAFSMRRGESLRALRTVPGTQETLSHGCEGASHSLCAQGSTFCLSPSSTTTPTYVITRGIPRNKEQSETSRLAQHPSPIPPFSWQCILLSREQLNKTKSLHSNGGWFPRPMRGSEAPWRLAGETEHVATLHSNEGSCPTGDLQRQSHTLSAHSTRARRVHFFGKREKSRRGKKLGWQRGKKWIWWVAGSNLS